MNFFLIWIEYCVEPSALRTGRVHIGADAPSRAGLQKALPELFILTLRLWLPTQQKWSSRLRDYLRFPPSPGAWRIGTFVKSIGRKVSEKESVELEAEDFLKPKPAQGWLSITHRTFEGEIHNNVKYIRRSLKPTNAPKQLPKRLPNRSQLHHHRKSWTQIPIGPLRRACPQDRPSRSTTKRTTSTWEWEDRNEGHDETGK